MGVVVTGERKPRYLSPRLGLHAHGRSPSKCKMLHIVTIGPFPGHCLLLPLPNTALT